MRQKEESVRPLRCLATASIHAVLLLSPSILGVFATGSLHEAFVQSKWLVLHVVGLLLTCCILPLYWSTNRRLPRRLEVSLWLLGSVAVGSSAIRDGLSISTGDRLVCWLLAYQLIWAMSAWPLFRLSLGRGFAVATVVVCGHSWLLAHGWLVLPPPLLAASMTPSSFGNPNMLAEFMLLSVILLDRVRRIDRELGWLSSFAMVLGLIQLSVIGSRSTLLALGCYSVVLGVGAIGTRLSRRWNRRIVVLGIISMAAVVWFGQEVYSDWMYGLGASDRIRVVGLLAAFGMIAERPLWGHGPDTFILNHADFVPTAWRHDMPLPLRTPHNEWLRFATEDGMVVTLLLAGVGLLLLLGLYRSLSSSPQRCLFIAGFSSILLQSSLQFPLKLGGSCFAVVGYLSLWSAPLLTFRDREWAAHRVRALVLLLLLALAGTSSFLRFLEISTRPSERYSILHLQRICRSYPQMWQSCIRMAEIILASKDPHASIRAVLPLLDRHPRHWAARSVYIRALDQLGRFEDVCREYDALVKPVPSFLVLPPATPRRCAGK